MNIKMILLFSHNLTNAQMTDAKEKFKISEFIYLPEKLQDLWSDIPTDIDNLNDISCKFKDFIKQVANKNDIVLIQGDFGMSYEMIKFCKSLNLKVVYSVTKRDLKEIKDGDRVVKTSIFKHLKFREY